MRLLPLAIAATAATAAAACSTPPPLNGLSRRAAIATAAGALFSGSPPDAAFAEATPKGKFYKFVESAPVWTPEATAEAYANIQNTYNPKFVAYFTRLLLNFDRASQSWWQDQNPDKPFVGARTLERDPELLAKQMADFQRLQGSVSLGLRAFQSTEGVRRLVAVLEDKIGGTEAGDRQLALLFSLMGENQPMDEISRLVAKVDDARVVRYNVDDPGSGYTRPPLVSVTAGAATDNEPATAKAIIAPTGRVYRLTLEYGGERYRRAPLITIAPPVRGGRRALAEATVDKRKGIVESVTIVDAGQGYSRDDEPLRIEVAPPPVWGEEEEEEVVYGPQGLKRSDRNAQFKGLTSSPAERAGMYGSGIGSPRYETNLESGRAPPPPPEKKPRSAGAVITGTLDYGISSVEVSSTGRGYGLDLPVRVVIAAPEGIPKGSPEAAQAEREQPADVLPVGLPVARRAQATAILDSPKADRRLTGWMPAISRQFAFTDLLPSTLVPQLDACLGRFTVSPVLKQEKDWCIYFEDEWAIVKESKLTTYFNPLDGSKSNSPIEREKPLGPSVFLRFAIGGALCNALSEGPLLPVYATKIRAQAEPETFPEGPEGAQRIFDEGADSEEGGYKALYRSLDTTILGYGLYGFFSFGGTELFERLFREWLGPNLATQYPVPILLAASFGASILAAIAYSPFEALRIRIISSRQDRGVVTELKEVIEREGNAALFAVTLPLTIIEIPYAAARFIVFDFTSRICTNLLSGQGINEAAALGISLFAGAISGIAASLVTQPLDTVVVRTCEESAGGEEGVPAEAAGRAGAITASAASDAARDGEICDDVDDEACRLALAEGAIVGAEAEGLTKRRPRSAAEWAEEEAAAADATGFCVVPDVDGEGGVPGILGFFNALVTIAKEEGVGALFAGATTRAVYIAGLSSIQFFLYEFIKQVLEVAPSDLRLFFDVLSGLELSQGG